MHKFQFKPFTPEITGHFEDEIHPHLCEYVFSHVQALAKLTSHVERLGGEVSVAEPLKVRLEGPGPLTRWFLYERERS